MIIETNMLPKHVNGMAIWPFILVRPEKRTERLVNHERIHLAQQLETLILPFYVLYLGFYLWNRMDHDHQDAYVRIPFEAEAFDHDDDLEYLDNRRLWEWAR